MTWCSYQMPPVIRPQLWMERQASASESSLVVMMPPSPAVRFLLDWKEKEPMWPMEPAGRFLKEAPWAWAASSMTVRRCPLAMVMMASMSAIWPAKWTGMMARVRDVMADLMARGSMLKVSRSMSAKTGMALASTTAEAVEKKV